ncbi:MAG TPA: acyl-CoA dehydrogenase family protein, partial [Protaetiibacter sp.]|nr:acyl-CoA dehydrogenase family protein [Protaetiibacter sp.]
MFAPGRLVDAPTSGRRRRGPVPCDKGSCRRLSKRLLTRGGRMSIYEDEHEMFRATVARFVDAELIPRHDEFVAARGFTPDVWRTAGEIGLLGLAVDPRFGGGGTDDYRFQAVAIAELARASAAAASAFSIHFDVCAPYLTELTDDAQRERWLPGFCTGRSVAAIAMTEPSGGSDLASLRTTATREGESWRLDGSKTFITNGRTAGIVIVAARTTPGKGARGISLFVVESGTEGLVQTHSLDKIGQHDADTAELFFDGLVIPAENLLGTVDRGFHQMMAMLPRERLGAAIANLAHAEHALALTLEHVKERTAFGSAIGRFQYNAFTLADLRTELDVGTAFVERCIVDLAGGRLDAVT